MFLRVIIFCWICFFTLNSFAASFPMMKKRFWGSVEYQIWQLKSANVPLPLVTTSDPVDFGVLNHSSTQVVIGDGSGSNEINFNSIPGGQLTLGAWIDPSERYGVEVSGFFLDQKTTRWLINTDDYSVLAIPFVNRLTGQESSQLIAYPNLIEGSTWFNNSSRLRGAEMNGLLNLQLDGPLQIIPLAGFRYLDLKESMTMTAKRRFLTSAVLPYNTELITNDYFSAQNYFYGLQMGAKGIYNYRQFDIEIIAKLALGATSESVDINGNTTPIYFNNVLMPIVTHDQGSFFALPSNSGSFHQTQFAVLPEVQFKLGYWVTPNIKPYVGYDFLYLSKVIRPNDQINRDVNPAQFPPLFGVASVESPNFHDSSFWAQGVNFGLELSY